MYANFHFYQFTISQNRTFYTFPVCLNISLTHLFGYKFIDQTVNKFADQVSFLLLHVRRFWTSIFMRNKYE